MFGAMHFIDYINRVKPTKLYFNIIDLRAYHAYLKKYIMDENDPLSEENNFMNQLRRLLQNQIQSCDLFCTLDIR